MQLLDINEQPIGGGRELKRRKKMAGENNMLPYYSMFYLIQEFYLAPSVSYLVSLI